MLDISTNKRKTSRYYQPKDFFTLRGLDTSQFKNYNSQRKDKYTLMLHFIIQRAIFGKKEFSDWMPLSKEILTHYFGTTIYKKILDGLIDANVLEYKNEYQWIGQYKTENGETSKGFVSVVNGKMQYVKAIQGDTTEINGVCKQYRIAAKYRDNIKITTTKIVNQKLLEKHHSYRTKEVKQLLKLNPSLRDELRGLSYVKIDSKAAKEYVKANYAEGSKQYANRMGSIREIEKLAELNNVENLGRGYHFVDNIDFTFTRDAQGRLYHPLTMCAKDIRYKFISFDYGNGKIKEADAVNSQLCFLTKYVDYLVDNHDVVKTFEHIMDTGGSNDSNELNNQLNFPKIGKPTHPIRSLTHQLHTPNAHPSIMRSNLTYKELAHKGLTYELFKEMTGFNGTRDEIKPELFKQLIYNAAYNNLTPFEKAFKEYYPLESYKLRQAKLILGRLNAKTIDPTNTKAQTKAFLSGNKLLACNVQRMEAEFWHGTIASLMRSEYPNIPYVIIHDSILLPAESDEAITDKIKELLSEYFGIQTQIKVQHFGN